VDDGWPAGVPEQHGLDPELIGAIGPRFEAWADANLHAILVVRHGVIVYEQYFAGEDHRWGVGSVGRVAYDASMEHDLRSITKSVTSLLVGIAVDRGEIRDLNASVFSFFPEHDDLRTPEKDQITLQHLLTMSAGLDWNEAVPGSDPQNSERRMAGAADLCRYVLEQPIASPPSQVWNYSGGTTELLAGILRKISAKALAERAKEDLFEPLGISDAQWMHYPNGEPAAASGLRLRPRDLAKIGQVVLDGGVWQGKQIVSAAWIEQSTTPQINGEGPFFYGYQWWLGRSLVGRREINWIAGSGLGGQAPLHRAGSRHRNSGNGGTLQQPINAQRQHYGAQRLCPARCAPPRLSDLKRALRWLPAQYQRRADEAADNRADQDGEGKADSVRVAWVRVNMRHWQRQNVNMSDIRKVISRNLEAVSNPFSKMTESHSSEGKLPNGRPFASGHDPRRNLGRPQGLAKLAREAMGDGRDLIDFHLAVFRGDSKTLGLRRDHAERSSSGCSVARRARMGEGAACR
jgi:CubicO group peptidase (beta-lactamase class C family)